MMKFEEKIAKMRISTRAALLFALVFGGMTIALAAFSMIFFNNRLIHLTETHQAMTVAAIADEIDDKLRVAKTSLAASATLVTPDLFTDVDKAQSFLDSQKALHQIFDLALFLVDEKGRIVVESPFIPEGRFRDISYREFYQVPSITKKPYISKPYPSKHAKDRPGIVVVIPVFDSDGRMIGRLHGGMELYGKNLLSDLAGRKIGNDGYFYVVTTDRTIIMHPNKNRIMNPAAPPGVNRMLDRALAGDAGSGKTTNSDGIEQIASFKRLGEAEWILASTYPLSELRHPLAQAVWAYAGFVLLIGCGMFLASRFIQKTLFEPVNDLTEQVQALNLADAAMRIHPSRVSAPEINLLSETFNRLLTSVENHQKDLATRVEERTADLSAANEELISVNEELTAMNEEIRLLNETLEDLKNVAEDANRAKSNFLANMSHEIRTPMNAILGMSYLIQQTPLSSKQRDFLGKIQTAGQVLLGIINDVLDLSKIEAEKMAMEHVPFHLDNVLERMTAIMGTRVAEKGLELKLEKASDIPGVIVGDPLRLNQVLTNLVSNAVKFTESGAIAVGVEKLYEDKTSLKLQFMVKDSGIGMSKEEQEKLFQVFSQLDASITRRYGGTGLGLAISKRLVNLMEGEIWVESIPGQGSTFYFTAKFGLGGEPVNFDNETALNLTALRQKSSLRGCRILLVDDNEINLDVAEELLGALGAMVTKAENGSRALEELKCGEFDAVLMDVHMPVMDGYEATKVLRSQARWRELPVIALTASAMHSDREKAMAAGMNDFIKKPVNPSELVMVLSKWVKPGEAPLDSAWERGIGGQETGENETPLLDIREALYRLNGNEKLHRALLEKFRESNVSTLERLNVALEDGHGEQVRMIVHSLKGAAGTMGAKHLQSSSESMEKALQGGNPAAIAAGCEAVSDSMRETFAAIDAYLLSHVIEEDGLSPGNESPLANTILNRLRESLVNYDTDASALFDELRRTGWRRNKQEEMGKLKRNIDRYAFEEALNMLDALICGGGGNAAK